MIKNDYHHGNLKDTFLEIALDFIKTDDVENLTLKVLSDKTGTSRSAIYRHFTSRDALIETMIEAGFDDFDRFVSPILRDKTKSLIDRFYLAGKGLINFAIENPNLYRLLFGKKYAHIREQLVSIEDDNCSGFGALKSAIEEGQKSGILKQDDSYKQAIVIWSSLHGLASLMIDGFRDVEKIYDEVYDTMFQSLLAGSMANKVKLISTIPFVNKLLQPKNP
ncbi:MAG: TetR/AcrR family transcriptional regulator [Arcobacteraceae bacterium]|nr:TetR/AcrR family transcriptional regulator [Arcobacteraceae bacterium]